MNIGLAHSEPIDKKSRHADFMYLVAAYRRTEHKKANDLKKKTKEKK